MKEIKMTLLDRAAQIEKAKQILVKEQQKKDALAEIGAQVLKQKEQEKLNNMLDKAMQIGIEKGLAAIYASPNSYNNFEDRRYQRIYSQDTSNLF